MQVQRESWKGRIGFLLAAVGSAVGLGNIWRFSYVAYEGGGGAFLIPYLVALLTAGLPILILEFGIGHKMRGAPPTAFQHVKNHEGAHFQGLGWWGVTLAMFGINLYYGVVISWCVQYLFSSFSLGWTQAASASAYFFTDVLQSGSGVLDMSAPVWPIVAGLAFVWLVNWVVVYKGVQSGIEKANKIFMPLLLVLMSILVIRGITLPGAGAGIAQYLTPDFGRLLDPGVWISAYAQIFFTLSVGFGIMIAYASYLPKRSNITGNAKIAAFLDCGFALFAGLAVFSTLGYLAAQRGVPVSEVVSGGVGLAFIVFPEAIAQIPVLPQVIGVVFFLALIVAGLSSSISLIEAFASSVVDKFGWKRKKIVTVLSLAGFGGGLLYTLSSGIFWLDVVDRFMTSYGLVTVGLLQCIVIGWIYGAKRIRTYINFVSSRRMGAWFDVSIKYITPIILMVILGVQLHNEAVQLSVKDQGRIAYEMPGAEPVVINTADLEEVAVVHDGEVITFAWSAVKRIGVSTTDLPLAIVAVEEEDIVLDDFSSLQRLALLFDDLKLFEFDGSLISAVIFTTGDDRHEYVPEYGALEFRRFVGREKVASFLIGALFLLGSAVAAAVLSKRKWKNETSLTVGHHFVEGEDYHLH